VQKRNKNQKRKGREPLREGGLRKEQSSAPKLCSAPKLTQKARAL